MAHHYHSHGDHRHDWWGHHGKGKGKGWYWAAVPAPSAPLAAEFQRLKLEEAHAPTIEPRSTSEVEA